MARLSGTRSSLPLFSMPTFWSANSGMNFATGSLSTKWPSSISIMMPTETIGFVMEKIRKIELCAIGADAAGFCLPSASNQPIWPRRATITVAPGRVPLSISRLKASDNRCSRTGERPSASGFPCGSGGVWGAVGCLAAACGVMVSPFALAWLGGILAQNGRVEQGVSCASPLQSGQSLCLKRRGSAATPGPHRSVAQLVEHRSPKPGVAGSSPATPASRVLSNQVPA